MSSVQVPLSPSKAIVRMPPKKAHTVGYKGIEEPLSVAKYHELIEAGVLTTEDKVELLNGRLVPKMSQNPPHRIAMTRTSRCLRNVIDPKNAHVLNQVPITLDTGEPEPDVCLVRGGEEAFENLGRHPLPTDVLLLAEIADSTLRFDRGEKLETYAAAGIEHYWIINLIDRRIECYSQPDRGSAKYHTVRHYVIGEIVEWQMPELGTLRLNVAELLPE